MDFHDPVRRDLRGSFLIVSGCPVGVDSVLEDGHIPVSDEVQVKGKVARIPIRQRSDVQMSPLRRATATYSPISPQIGTVSSQTVGKPAMNSVHSGSAI